jgi:5-formyltetrahydrofolate cyclo-ligase
MKSILRNEIRIQLKSLTPQYIDLNSKIISRNVLELLEYKNCKSISVFLSMKHEVNTAEIINASFVDSKKLYIPKIIGSNAPDMIMFPLENIDEINNFPKTKWGIPEPPMDVVNAHLSSNGKSHIDLIIVPGVAFDSNCGRIGQGKGYYGTI